MINEGIIKSNGTSGGLTTMSGGSSGGGSVNVFYKLSYSNTGTVEAVGGTSGNGGAGGEGSVTIGCISTGSFVQYNEENE